RELLRGFQRTIEARARLIAGLLRLSRRTEQRFSGCRGSRLAGFAKWPGDFVRRLLSKLAGLIGDVLLLRGGRQRVPLALGKLLGRLVGRLLSALQISNLLLQRLGCRFGAAPRRAELIADCFGRLSAGLLELV